MITHDDFKKLVEARLRICEATLLAKGKKYNPKDDRLHSFKRAGMVNDVAPTTALQGMVVKHYCSYLDQIRLMQEDSAYTPTEAWIEETVTDLINYMMLFEGLVADRRASAQPMKSYTWDTSKETK